jgi:predicted secreted Zn-dependent protease
MLNRFFLFTFLLLTFSAIRAQDPGEDILTWNAARKLTWSDYKAKPNPNSDASATTRTYLAIDYHISTDNFSYTIRSSFSRSFSWGRDKTDYILSHEQGHFDLAEVFARKLHKRMSEYRFDKRTFQKELKKIYDEVATEKAATQEQYDRETRHSIDTEKQAEWLKKISRMLEELKDYADY